MVTTSEYLQIIQHLSNVALPYELLERIKTKYKDEISSHRATERCRNLKDLIDLLEKRDLINEDNVAILKDLAATLNSTHIIQIETARIPGTELSNRILLLWSTLLVMFDHSVCWLYNVVSSISGVLYCYYFIYIFLNFRKHVMKPTMQFVDMLFENEPNFKAICIVYCVVLLCLVSINLIIYIIKILVLSWLLYFIRMYLLPLFNFLYVKYKVSVFQAKNHMQTNRHYFLS